MTANTSAPNQVVCPVCGKSFFDERAPAPVEGELECPGCTREFRLETFPAFYRDPLNSEQAESLHSRDEASCYFHPSSRAAAVCEECGRFVCSLCDMPIGTRHYCPSCLAAGTGNQEEETLADQHVLYDNIAIFMAVAPLVTCWLTLISAPVTLLATVFWWRRPLSIVPRSKGRYVTAAGIALAELVAWGFYLYAVFHLR
ncbi:MAG: hypothetical protein P8Z49_08505 [Acidobacteriota bacterium]